MHRRSSGASVPELPIPGRIRGLGGAHSGQATLGGQTKDAFPVVPRVWAPRPELAPLPLPVPASTGIKIRLPSLEVTCEDLGTSDERIAHADRRQ